MSEFLERIASELRVPGDLLETAVRHARGDAKQLRIPKRSGGYRTVWQPSQELKLVHYWLLQHVFEQVPLHPAAVAYRRGLNTLENAERHLYGRFFLKVDFRDFFPSLRPDDVLRPLRVLLGSDSPVALDADFENVFRQACFQRGDRMAQGYPTSPMLSNIAMVFFDRFVTDTLVGLPQRFGPHAVYTRYADDIVISTHSEAQVREALSLIEEALTREDTPRLTMHWDKLRLTSRRSGNVLVTGLRITQDGKLQLPRKYRDVIELLMKLRRKGNLDLEDAARLTGHLNYARLIAPAWVARLEAG